MYSLSDFVPDMLGTASYLGSPDTVIGRVTVSTFGHDFVIPRAFAGHDVSIAYWLSGCDIASWAMSVCVDMDDVVPDA